MAASVSLLGPAEADELRALPFTVAGMRFGARQIWADLGGKAVRRVVERPSHRLIGARIDGVLVAGAYHEPFPSWDERVGDGSVARRLSWLVVADGWRGRTLPSGGVTVAAWMLEAVMADVAAVVPPCTDVVAKVHSGHRASLSLLLSQLFVPTGESDGAYTYYLASLP